MRNIRIYFVLGTEHRNIVFSKAYVYNYTHRIKNMRTNIDLDNQLVEEAQGLSGIKTKKAVVEKALRVFIKIERQNQIESLHHRMKVAASLLEADYMKDEDLTDLTVSLDGEDFHE